MAARKSVQVVLSVVVLGTLAAMLVVVFLAVYRDKPYDIWPPHPAPNARFYHLTPSPEASK